MSVPSPFVLANVDWNRSTEMSLLLEAVAGEAVISFGPTFPGPDTTPTGLANDATVYTMDVVTQAGTSSIAVTGSAAQTMAALATEIDADFTGGETLELVGDILVITSAATGPTSFVTVTDTGANPLLASLGQTGSAGWGVISNQSFKGNNRYLRYDKMDSGQQNNLDFVIDAFLAAATANTNVAWTSGSDAVQFPTLSPTAFTDTGLVRTTVYQLNVAVDGVATLGNDGDGELFLNLEVPQLAPPTSFQHLLQVINEALATQGFGASASFDAGSPLTLRITSDLVGTASEVEITDGGVNPLLTALAAFGPINAPATTPGKQNVTDTSATVIGATVTALGAATYDFDIAIDGGVNVAESIIIGGGESYTAIAALMAAEMSSGTCTFDDTLHAFVFTSGSSGLSSSILVAVGTAGSGGGDLFAALDAADSTTFLPLSQSAPIAGTDADGVNGTTNVSFPVTKAGNIWDNWNEVLLDWPSLTGFGVLHTSGSGLVFEREDKPAAAGDAVETRVYWDGAAWKFFEDDATLGAAVNPPEA